MSEYPMTQTNQPEEKSSGFDALDHLGTLFEDAVSASADVHPIKPEVSYGVYVTLEERKTALEALSKLYGRRNKARGLVKISSIPPVRIDTLEPRYKDVDAVVTGLSRKVENDIDQFPQHYDVLTKSQQLKDAGFDYDDVDSNTDMTQIRIRHDFGSKSRHADREKLLRKVRKSAEAIKNSNSAA